MLHSRVVSSKASTGQRNGSCKTPLTINRCNMLNNWLKCSLFNLMLVLTLTACAGKSPSYDSASVDPIRLPAIPPEFRQESLPQWCSLTCTQAVWDIDRTSQVRLTDLGYGPVK